MVTEQQEEKLTTFQRYEPKQPLSVRYSAQYWQITGVWGEGTIRYITVTAEVLNPEAGCKTYFQHLVSLENQPARVRLINLEPEPGPVSKQAKSFETEIAVTPGPSTPLDEVLVVDLNGTHVVKVAPGQNI